MARRYERKRSSSGRSLASILSGGSSGGGGLDLNDPEVLKQLLKTQGVEPEEPGPGALDRFFGLLSVGETGDAMYRTLEDNAGGIDLKDIYQFPMYYAQSWGKRGSLQGEEDMKRYGDVIRLMLEDYGGVKPGKDNKAANLAIGAGGFLGDVFLDPLTYLSVGAVSKAGKGGKALSKADDAVDLAKLIGGTDEVVDLVKPLARESGALGRNLVDDVAEAGVKNIPEEETARGLKRIIEGITGKGPQEVSYKLPFGLQKEAAVLRTVENPWARAAIRTFENPLRPIGGSLMGTPVVGDALEGAKNALGDLFRPLNRLRSSGLSGMADDLMALKDTQRGAEIEAMIKAGEFERAANELGNPEIIKYLTEETSLEDIAKLAEKGVITDETARAYENVYRPTVRDVPAYSEDLDLTDLKQFDDRPYHRITSQNPADYLMDADIKAELLSPWERQDYEQYIRPQLERIAGDAKMDSDEIIIFKSGDGRWVDTDVTKALGRGRADNVKAYIVKDYLLESTGDAAKDAGGERLLKEGVPEVPLYGAGAIAGVEPEYDEEGNITGFGYDPVKGFGGFAGTMVGEKALRNFGEEGLNLFKNFVGIEGKQRWLVDDAASKLDIGKLAKEGTTKLSDVFSHPELEKMYGASDWFVKEAKALGLKPLKEMDIAFAELPEKTWGRYNPEDGIFLINSTLKGSEKEAQGTLLHEIQHYIQDVEDFAQGGSPRQFVGDIAAAEGARAEIEAQIEQFTNVPEIRQAINESDRIIRDMLKEGLDPYEAEQMYVETVSDRIAEMFGEEYASTFRALNDELIDVKSIIEDGGKSQYKRLGGEIEADEVKRYFMLSDEEKANYVPYSLSKAARGITDDADIINITRSQNAGIEPMESVIDELDRLGEYGDIIGKQQGLAEAARQPFEQITGKGTLDNYIGRDVIKTSKEAEDAAKRVGMNFSGFNPVRAYENAVNKRVYDKLAEGELAGVVYSSTGKTGKEAAKDYARQVAVDYIRGQRAVALDNFIENNVKNGLDDFGERVAIQTDEALDGYKEVAGIPSLKGWKVRNEIADEMTKMHKAFFSDEGTNQFLKYYDKVMGGWKLSVTGLFPSFHARNFIGNNYLNWLADVNPKYQKNAIDVQRYMKAVIDGTDNASELGAKRVGNYTIDEIFNLAKERAVMGSGPTMEAIDMAGGQTALGALGLGKIEGLARGVGTSVEDNAKIAHFIDKLVKTGDPDEAAMSVKKYLFDYGDLTDFEKNVMRRVIPFYTFMRKNLELHISEMFNNPRKLRMLTKGLNAIQDTSASMSGMTEEDIALMPDWAKKSLGIYTGKEGDTVNLVASFGLPIEQLDDLIEMSKPTFGENVKGTFGNLINQSSPLLKTPLEMSSGYNYFREQPIEEDTSANAYRSILEKLSPEQLDQLGIRTYEYEDRTTGETRTGYEMDAETKYLINALAGKSASTATRASSALSGDAPANNLLSLFSGVRNYEFDLGRQQYYKDKDDRERLQKLLIEMGLLSEFTRPYLTDEAKDQGLAGILGN